MYGFVELEWITVSFRLTLLLLCPNHLTRFSGSSALGGGAHSALRCVRAHFDVYTVLYCFVFRFLSRILNCTWVLKYFKINFVAAQSPQRSEVLRYWSVYVLEKLSHPVLFLFHTFNCHTMMKVANYYSYGFVQYNSL